MRQLLQNETENSYQKFITKCDKGLLQCASGIAKCGRSLLQSASGITKCDSYYKARCNKIISKCFLTFGFFLSKYKFFEVATFFLS